MSISTAIRKTKNQITNMDEMKRWQGEREDRLHQEHVRERMLARASDQKQPAKKPK